MRLVRSYCENITKGQIRLGQSESHHLTDVMRLGAGSEIELFDGQGTVAKGIVKSLGRKAVVAAVSEIRKELQRTQGRVVIAASLAKAKRFEQVITMCTELGVDHIAAVLFERTVKQAKGVAAIERYKKLVISAVKQCGRSFLPKITAPLPLAECIKELKAEYPQAKVIYGGFGTPAKSIFEIAECTDDVIAFVGPEGGLTEAEGQLLKENAACKVRLGETVLRVETAAVAFGAILCTGR